MGAVERVARKELALAAEQNLYSTHQMRQLLKPVKKNTTIFMRSSIILAA